MSGIEVLNSDQDVAAKIIEKDTENDNSIHETTLNLSDFQVIKLLNANNTRKVLCLEGKFKGREEAAVVVFEKKTFPEEKESIQEGFFTEDAVIRKNWRNDVYGNYECFPASKFNGLNTTIIHPATKMHIDKYSKKQMYLVEETFEIYKNVTLPHLEAQQFSLQWVYNILEGKAEVERVVCSDKNEETGFVLVPDLKWDGNPSTLYLLAISMKRIRSIRELNGDHLPLLKNIRDSAYKVIEEKYNVVPSQLRAYFHYQPSFYHLHVHFTVLNYDAPGITVERAHLLSTVINNIELVPDYYQKSTLSFAVFKGDPLFRKFVENKILPSEEVVIVEAEN